MTQLLGIYVKSPEPGQVKTRLAAKVGDDQAAVLYRAFLSDLTSRFRGAGDRRFLCYSPATKKAEAWFQDLAGGDYELWPQPEGSLTPRLSRFFDFAHHQGSQTTVVIGSDSPTIPIGFLEEAFKQLKVTDAVLGPATDGGYYLLGLKKPLPIFEGIAWSTPSVLRQTVNRLREEAADLALLPPWYDVDTGEDLELLRGHLEALVHSGDELVQTLSHTRQVLTDWIEK